MNTTKDKKKVLPYFSPSVNILRDAVRPLHYIVTPNSAQVFTQIVDGYKRGLRCFNIVGAYGTGKSAFLLAFQKNVNGEVHYFSKKHFHSVHAFDTINIIGESTSLVEAFKERFGLSKQPKARPKDILLQIDQAYHAARKHGKGLMIVVDELGKYLEYIAKHNPESELYFIQQLAEFCSDITKDILFITTLHQNFNEYSKELSKQQRNEWDKVKGRLKEITFNEPVEQLLFLAAEQLHANHQLQAPRSFNRLFKCIEKSKAFPLRDYFSEAFAEKLLPFDILSASVLTLSLQRYGQNERSLFSFIHSNDPLGLQAYQSSDSPFYALPNVYDYLMHNFNSLLTTRYNPDYGKWAAIRNAIERAEGAMTDQLVDAVRLLKVIGLLNIFSSAGICLDTAFLKEYAHYAMGVKNAEVAIKALEGLRIIRFVKHASKYILFEGTDLDIELAINQAGLLVEKVTNVVHHLNQYFDFPYLAAKAIHYRYGVPRYFSFTLTEVPVQYAPQGEIDGFINLIFSDSLDRATLISTSEECEQPIFYGWFQNTTEIKELLYEIEKIKKVIESHDDDKVARRELDSILQHQIALLNHYVIGNLYRQSKYLRWFYRGQEVRIESQKAFNRQLSQICHDVYNAVPAYKNEMVNKSRLSSPIQTARKNFLRAMVEHWDKKDFGFEQNKFPPEKTIYLSLVKASGMHTEVDALYTLGKPTNNELRLEELWDICYAFLESTYTGKRKLGELVDKLLAKPFKLKQGFIDFWLPLFLFTVRDDYALFSKGIYLPFITPQTLELISKEPDDYEVKAFQISGDRLNLFNSYRLLLNQSEKNTLTNNLFIETIRPFLTFYKNLPEYTKKTLTLDKQTLALREAIALAKDPEDSFFVQFPKAMGYDIRELKHDKSLLRQYHDRFQEGIKNIRNCYTQLVTRVESFLCSEILGSDAQFPLYRIELQERYRTLKRFMLLPHQTTVFQRLYSEMPDRNAWLNSIVHACLGKPLEEISDDEEKLLYVRLKEVFHELDNLTEIGNSGFDSQREIAFQFEVTSFMDGLKRNMVRLPKSKEKELQRLQKAVRANLSNDKQLNIATLAKMLEELLANES